MSRRRASRVSLCVIALCCFFHSCRQDVSAFSISKTQRQVSPWKTHCSRPDGQLRLSPPPPLPPTLLWHASITSTADDDDVESPSDRSAIRRILSKFRRVMSYPFRKVINLLRTSDPADTPDGNSIENNCATLFLNEGATNEFTNGMENDHAFQYSTLDWAAMQASAEEAMAQTIGELKEAIARNMEQLTGSLPQQQQNTMVDIDDNLDVITSSVQDRAAQAAGNVDLSGVWDLVVDDDFKHQYDRYLTLLGQPFLVRSVAVSIVGMTQEEIIQSERGRELLIRGRNMRGMWERSLRTSGATNGVSDFVPIRREMYTADGEKVKAEAWWQDSGRVHFSVLRGVQKYGGGEFQSRRYLQDDGNTLVCESTFVPHDPEREQATVKWTFRRH